MEKNKKQKLEKIGNVAIGCGMIASEFAICFFSGLGVGRILKEHNCGKATQAIAIAFVGAVTPHLLGPVFERAIEYIISD